jgi:hypothetical protein
VVSGFGRAFYFGLGEADFPALYREFVNKARGGGAAGHKARSSSQQKRGPGLLQAGGAGRVNRPGRLRIPEPSMRLLLALAAATLTNGCVAISATERPSAPACQGQMLTETRLYLGMESPKGPVSEEAFRTFIDVEVTPRWKEGYTVLSAEGRWLSEARHIAVREPTRILVRLNDASSAARADIEAIRKAYVSQFAQDSVLRTDAPTCASF